MKLEGKRRRDGEGVGGGGIKGRPREGSRE